LGEAASSRRRVLAGAYDDLKRTLAARLGTDRAGYTEAKSAFIKWVLAASPQRP
jgi:GrpB-like predicted nucleotidyltransferase (UPF0157 family)